MTDLAQQYDALLNGAGFCDLSGRTQIEITGADRAAVLHGLCTNDIKRLTPGTGCEAFLTDVQGKTIGYLDVFCLANSLVLDTAAGLAEETIAAIDRFVIREDVTLVDRSKEWREVLLSGKNATALLATLIESEAPTEPLGVVECRLDTLEAEVRRVSFASKECFFLRCAAAHVASLCNALRTSGAVACSQEAVETARIEMGSPVFGKDVTAENLPQEVNRPQAISFTKGCYLGQETVARIDAMGHVNWKLLGLQFSGDEVPPPGSQVEIDGKPVAKIKSSCPSQRLQAPLAMAYVRRGQDQLGNRLPSEFGEAEVIALPVE